MFVACEFQEMKVSRDNSDRVECCCKSGFDEIISNTFLEIENGVESTLNLGQN